MLRIKYISSHNLLDGKLKWRKVIFKEIKTLANKELNLRIHLEKSGVKYNSNIVLFLKYRLLVQLQF